MGDPNRPPPPDYPQGSQFRPPLPGQPPSPAGVPPPHQQPMARPGFQQPHQQLASGFAPGRPALSPTVQAAGARPSTMQQPIDPTMSPTTIQQRPATLPLQSPGPGATSLTSPTVSQQHADHHRRKRMYPEQITKAYMEEPNSNYSGAAYPGAPQQQQQQAPATAPAYAQQPQQPNPAQDPYAYGQGGVNSMTAQFGNMGMGGAPPPQVWDGVIGLAIEEWYWTD